MVESEVKGVIPPLTTPFTEEGEIYEEGLRNLLDFQVEKGSHGLFLCGTYGSGPLMSLDQRKRVVEIAKDHVGERITIIVHVGTTNTRDSVELAKHAEENGAAAVAAVPPYYYRHDEKTVLEHFRQLVKAVDIPVYVYNNPKTSGFTVTPSTLVKMVDLGVKGIKDSGFSIIEFSHFVIELADRREFNFIIGTEALFLPAMLLGANGCISGLANAFPEVVVELYNKIMNKNYEEAKREFMRILELNPPDEALRSKAKRILKEIIEKERIEKLKAQARMYIREASEFLEEEEFSLTAEKLKEALGVIFNIQK